MAIYFEKYGLCFRTVDVNDAEFILSLRTNIHLARFLSATPSDIEQQKKWIEDYQKREKQNLEFYFVAQNINGEMYGLNRLYNFNDNSFEAGSWIYKEHLNFSISIFGDFAVRDYGFEVLQFPFCRFEVRKENHSVVKYHHRFKPTLVKEDELNYYFILSYENYALHRDKLLKMIGNGVITTS